jgi:hypothetical protein
MIRLARCSCGKTEASNSALFMFQNCSNIKDCKCGYAKVAHEHRPNDVCPEPIVCTVGGYTPVGDLGFDRYYCGCRGCD